MMSIGQYGAPSNVICGHQCLLEAEDLRFHIAHPNKGMEYNFIAT